jgi:hypothetical protein
MEGRLAPIDGGAPGGTCIRAVVVHTLPCVSLSMSCCTYFVVHQLRWGPVFSAFRFYFTTIVITQSGATYL